MATQTNRRHTGGRHEPGGGRRSGKREAEAAYAKVMAMIDDPLEPTEAQKKFMAVRIPA